VRASKVLANQPSTASVTPAATKIQKQAVKLPSSISMMATGTESSLAKDRMFGM
jgi:hypothetical protein